jgi:PAS domain S-box-containing protein
MRSGWRVKMRKAAMTDMLNGGGEMGRRMRLLDWEQTPFGPPEDWPQSLRSAVSICLNSRFPIAIYWGPQLALLYNDSWSTIPGEKHPWALGRPGREVWPEIWSEIGPLFETVQRTGEGVWQQDQLLPMHRHGYTEECYFNFTFSPIRGEDGSVAGIFNAVVETTYRVIEERRAQLLRDLTARTAGATTAREVCARAAAVAEAGQADVPFCLFYLREEEHAPLELAAAAGAALPPQLRPPTLDPADPAAPWEAEAALQAPGGIVVDRLGERYGVAPRCGTWPEAVGSAVVIPVAGQQGSEPPGLLVFGISPRRALDEAYRTFVERFALQIATAFGNAHAYAAERKRAEALAELDRAKTAFFSNISHEFRTPLTLMLAPLEDLLQQADGALAPEARDQLRVAHRNALRLLKLVNTLLDFSRIEAGRLEAAYEPTDLASLTAELAGIFRSAIERAGLRLVIDCPPLPEPVYVDRELWQQIVFNLLSNALKFTLAGEIVVTLRQAGRTAKLSVRDTGAGIPPEELPRLFARFHRVRGARGRTIEGSGIGLALVAELVKLHGGTIEVASELDRGTTFTVSLPAGAAHLPADRVAATRPAGTSGLRGEAFLEEALGWLPASDAGPQDSAGAGASGGVAATELAVSAPPGAASVLLADDNADMLAYLRRLLGERYRVVAVADGAAALRAAREQPFDLVLADVMMPRLDGFGLIAALRADPATSATPVILLSARAGEEARIEGMRAGADDYLVKPFSAKELLARVETRLEVAGLRREAVERERALRAEAQAARNDIERVLNQLNDHYAAYDLDWRYVFVNAKAAEVLGLPVNQLIGNRIWDLFPDAVGNDYYRVLHQALAEQRDLVFEFFYAPFNRWFENRIYASPEGVAVLGTDITERKLAELNLAFLSGITEDLARLTNIDEVMQVVGAKLGTHLHLSLCAFAVIDEAAGEATVTHDWHRDELPSAVGTYRIADFVSDAFQESARAGELFVVRDTGADPRVGSEQYAALGIRSFVSVPLIRDGRWRFMLNVYDTVVRDWRDEEIALIREVTARIWTRLERHRAEAKLRESEARYRTLFTSIDQGFCVIDVLFDGDEPVDYRFVEINPTFEKHTGLRDAEGNTARQLLPNLEAKWFAIYGAIARTGKPMRFVDGSEVMGRWFDVYAFRIGDAPSDRVAILFSDITERKRAEQERERLLEREQELRRQAEEASRLKDEFLATVSHELRTPLTAFLGYAQMLQLRQRDEAYIARTVEKMVRSAKSQAQLIEDLLDVSRIVSGKLRLDPQPVDMRAVVRAALDTVRPAADAKGLAVRLLLGGGGDAVIGDASRLQQVVWNLLSNAAKFTPAGGTITVRLERSNGHMKLAVSDTGQGIHPGFLPYVFDRFRQADGTTNRVHGGLGLGLAIVRHVVELHGGGVQVASDGEGQGATFTVWLPLAAGASAAQGPLAKPEEADAGASAELSGLRVLVVDDQQDILELLSDVLAASGAVVRSCGSARDALETVREWRPDVLVSDIAMPGEDGYWLIEQVRALAPEEGGATPAVALTAYVRVEDRLRVLAAGYQQYVPKPVEPAELRDVVARLGRAPTPD